MQAWTGGLLRVAKEAGKLTRKKRKRAVFTKEAKYREQNEETEVTNIPYTMSHDVIQK